MRMQTSPGRSPAGRPSRPRAGFRREGRGERPPPRPTSRPSPAREPSGEVGGPGSEHEHGRPPSSAAGAARAPRPGQIVGHPAGETSHLGGRARSGTPDRAVEGWRLRSGLDLTRRPGDGPRSGRASLPPSRDRLTPAVRVAGASPARPGPAPSPGSRARPQPSGRSGRGISRLGGSLALPGGPTGSARPGIRGPGGLGPDPGRGPRRPKPIWFKSSLDLYLSLVFRDRRAGPAFLETDLTLCR